MWESLTFACVRLWRKAWAVVWKVICEDGSGLAGVYALVALIGAGRWLCKTLWAILAGLLGTG